MKVRCDCGHEFTSGATMPTCPECHKRFRASSHEVAIHHDTPRNTEDTFTIQRNYINLNFFSDIELDFVHTLANNYINGYRTAYQNAMEKAHLRDSSEVIKNYNKALSIKKKIEEELK